MAAGGCVSNHYWLKQAEYAYEYSVLYPDMNWEQLMYVYLFWSVGYEE
jgi:hypothetical protein